MPEQDVQNLPAILDELIKTEKGMLRLSQLIQDDIKHEIESISAIAEEVRNDREKATAAFANFDQKTNQLFNVLSTVLKSIKEMQSAVTRNLL